MGEAPSSTRRALVAALVASVFCVGLVSYFLQGFSSERVLRLVEAIALFGLGGLVVGGAVVFALLRLAGWRDPESDAEFDQLVERTERLAADDPWVEDDDDPWAGFDDDLIGVAEDEIGGIDEEPWAAHERGAELDHGAPLPSAEADEFKALVRSALDELPLEFHRALEHVAIVVSDSGAEALPGASRGAYGLYQGDTVARDHFHDRILIFRDTLTRDFGHDPELLRAQVRRTVRHEIAHHLGWDEKGVRGLGL